MKITTNCHLANVEKYIEKYSQYALDVEAIYNIPAIAILAQSALETGWGEMILWVYCNGVRICSNNMFNLKVHDWKGAKGSARVNEFIDGVDVKDISDYFRVYPSAAESFDDYGKYITTRKKPDGTLRYASAFNLTDDVEYIKEIAAAGYATDPVYANTIIKIISMFQRVENG